MNPTARPAASQRQPLRHWHRTLLARLLKRSGIDRLAADRSGVSAILIGLLSMGLLGFSALGTEVVYWYTVHRNLQNAADSAALSAVAALENLAAAPDSTHMSQATAEAKYTSQQYGFTGGAGGVIVTVNIPPSSGAYTSNPTAAEVILSAPQKLFLSTALTFNGARLFPTQPTQKARAVATPAKNGNGCVVTLNTSTVTDLSLNGNTTVNMQSCDLYVNSQADDALNQVGNATVNAEAAYIAGGTSSSGNAQLNTTVGTFTGTAPINDPYGGLTVPYTSPGSSCSAASPPTMQHVQVRANNPAPGETDYGPDGTGNNIAVFCGGWQLASNTTNVLEPGLYVIDGGTFGCNNCTVTGQNVTIYLTGSGTNWASIAFGGNGTSFLNIDAPTDTFIASAPANFKGIEGVAIFGDRNAPCTSSSCTASMVFSGNATELINGVIYLPKQSVQLNGNGASSPSCSQLIAYTATFVGNSAFSTSFSDDPNDTTNCNRFRNAITGAGIAGAGAIPAHLVE
jgi:Flp pilus assembly protein TadG